SAVGAPIVVDGAVWGAIVVSKTGEELFPEDAERRLGDFAALVAQAIANAEAREHLASLAEEQAALRRVATVAASGSPRHDVLDAVGAEVGAQFDAQTVALMRWEGVHDEVRVVGAWNAPEEDSIAIGCVYRARGDNATIRMLETGPAARGEEEGRVMDESDDGEWHELGRRSVISAPLIVAASLWGSLTAIRSRGAPFPPHPAARLKA